MLGSPYETGLDSGIAELYLLPITSLWREDLSRKDLRLGRSVLAFSTMAFAVSFVWGAGNFGNSANAQAAPIPSIADSDFRRGIYQRYPNYNSFSEADIATLNEADLRGLLGFVGNKANGYQSLIPQSYVRQYGADAEARFMQALAFDAARRGQPAMYAYALLNGGLAGQNNRSNGAAAVNSNVVVSLPLADGTSARTTAPEALNYAVAATAITATNVRYEADTAAAESGRASTYTPNFEAIVRVPPAALAAIVAANPGLPPSVATENYSLRVRDEVAFLAGYATQAGASREIGVIQIPLTQQHYCSAPKVRNNAFRANAPSVDIGEAFLAGAAMRRYDTMSDAEFQRIRSACPN